MRGGDIGKPPASNGSMSLGCSTQKTCILAVDDEVGFLGFLKMALECEGYTVHIASTPAEAILFYQKR